MIFNLLGFFFKKNPKTHLKFFRPYKNFWICRIFSSRTSTSQDKINIACIQTWFDLQKYPLDPLDTPYTCLSSIYSIFTLSLSNQSTKNLSYGKKRLNIHNQNLPSTYHYQNIFGTIC